MIGGAKEVIETSEQPKYEMIWFINELTVNVIEDAGEQWGKFHVQFYWYTWVWRISCTFFLKFSMEVVGGNSRPEIYLMFVGKNKISTAQGFRY